MCIGALKFPLSIFVWVKLEIVAKVDLTVSVTNDLCLLHMYHKILSYAQQQLFSCGALDVYTLPSNMKKGRSGGAVILGVVCLDNQPIIDSLTKTIFRETTSLGVRMMTGTRCALTREIILVETQWGRVHVKVRLCLSLSASNS